ncbi:MAG: deiodinase family protein [Planctomycetaceae bacterium]|nr:deiodinase family protein [Planctomycetaceae bacterium]
MKLLFILPALGLTIAWSQLSMTVIQAEDRSTITVSSVTVSPEGTPPAPGPELLKYTPEEIERAYEGQPLPEGVRMYLAIVRGGKMNGSEGWFGPAATRYRWDWLCRTHHISGDRLDRKQFLGDPSAFQILDRNNDGYITADDLDWSDTNEWVRNSYAINRWFRRMDESGNGEFSRSEWVSLFDRLAGQSDEIRFDQLRDSIFAGSGAAFQSGDAPTKETLVQGLLAEEVGSLKEGPPLEGLAPDFELPVLNGDSTISLQSLVGQKPVVLIFGNFTCGPFRSMYPAVERVVSRHRDDASFLMIYVREAHPANGWAMKSNQKAGIEILQPVTLEQRVDVAQQCSKMLEPTIPLLVDDVDDRTGHAYSGMPARLYVIDRKGKVAYKSGRGPFGFKVDEMEQSLVMLQLDEQIQASPPNDAEK